MSESAVALRYAEALYELSVSEGKKMEVLQDLAALRDAFDGDSQGWSTLMNPLISRQEKEKLVNERFSSGRERLVQNFLGLLVRKGRETVLRDLFRAYQEVYDRNEDIVRIEVESASALSAEEVQSLRERISQAMGRDVVIETRVDADLLGGLRFSVDSRVVDGSLKSQLEKLKRHLLQSGVA